MALALGGNQINKAYLGSTEIQRMYLGNELVFDNTIEPSNLFPVLSNYRVLQSNPNRIYFDSSKAITASNVTGWFIGNGTDRTISSVTINTGLLTGHYFTVSANYTYWNQAMSIRYEWGSDMQDAEGNLLNKVTLSSVYNQMDEPTATLTKWVADGASGSGNSEGDPMAFTTAASESAANTTYNVKIGNYGDINLSFSNNGGVSTPAKFIGYKVTPGDITSNYYDNLVTMSSAEMPTITNSSYTSDITMTLNSSNYLILRNIQMTHGSRGIYTNGSNIGNVVFDRVNAYDYGDTSNNQACVYISKADLLGQENLTFKDCVFIDGSQSNLYVNTNGSCLFDGVKTYNNSTVAGKRTDYQIAFNGHNNVVRNCYSESLNQTSTNLSTHGIGVRGETKGSSTYNLIEQSEMVNLQECFYVRNKGSNYNVIKDNLARNNGAPVTGYAYPAGLAVWGGSDYNIFERNTVKDLRMGLYLYDNNEDGQGVAEIGSNNTFRNNIFDNLVIFAFVTNGPDATWTSNKFYYNTLNDITYMYKTDVAIVSSGNEWKYNIFKDCANLNTGTTIGGWTYDYNDFSGSWTNGIGSNDINVDPKFEDEVDFLPQAEALRIGLAVGGLDYDFNNSQRVFSSTVGGVILKSEQVDPTPPVTDYDFYVSATGTGDGLSESTPMSFAQSQTTINSMTAGQSIAYKGGDEFYGVLDIQSRDGITLTSYGTGKAVFRGSKDLDGFVGTDVWTASTGTDTIYQVFKDGDAMTNARLPEVLTDYGYTSNYLIISAVTSQTVFVCDELIGEPDIVGSSIHILGNPWTLSTRIITDFNSSTGEVTIDSEVDGTLYNITQFCINNHVNLLTTENNDRWYWESSTLSIRSNGIEPTGISYSTINDNGINIYNSDNLTISNIQVRDYNITGIRANICINLTLENIDAIHNYYSGMHIFSDDYNSVYTHTINNCTVNGSDYGIKANTPGATVTNNTILDSGVLKNITPQGYQGSQGIQVYSTDGVVSDNSIINTGYGPVNFSGQRLLVEKNYIEGYCTTKYDGAGIYTWNDDYASPGARDSIIDKNTIISVGDIGTWNLFGVYMDDRVHDVSITDNNISGGYSNIYLHNNKDNIVTGNKLYEATVQNILLQEDTIAGIGMTGNSLDSNQYFQGNTLPTMKVSTDYADYNSFGTFNNNVYYGSETSTPIQTKANNITENKTLLEWQGEGFDANSTSNVLVSPVESFFAYNPTGVADDITLPTGTWNSIDGTITNAIGTINISAYSSEILIKQ